MDKKEFLDIDGLKQYDALIKKYIDDAISSSLNSSTIAEKYDDVKTYNTLSAFPTTGVEDSLYIDLSTGNQYVWNGSSYVAVEDSIDDNTINSLT